jgi:hypothetical protein
MSAIHRAIGIASEGPHRPRVAQLPSGVPATAQADAAQLGLLGGLDADRREWASTYEDPADLLHHLDELDLG